MSKVPFSTFNDAIQQQFAVMVASGFPLVSLEIHPDAIWETYLGSFPEGTNPIFRQRREYDCNCCKNFVRRLGNVVAITPNGYMTIWDVEVQGYYNDVAKAMAAYAKKHTIRDIYVTSEPVAGSKPNKDNTENVTWTHFYVQVPKQFVKHKDNIGSYLSNFRSSFQVFERAMNELKLDAFETVNELITQGSLYRGAEFKKTVADFLKLKKQYDELNSYGYQRIHFLWHTVKTLGDTVRFRNTAIGSLVTDLSDGMDLEKAVSSFESKVAPQNYKRPTSLVTPSMIAAAQDKIEELGLTASLSRRFATIEDIDVKNVLFTSQNVKSLNVFDDLMEDAESKVKEQSLVKVEEISLDHFLKNVIPTAKQIEVLFENKHTNNLVSLLTSVDPDAPSLFKWKNNFSWSYNGEVADSLRNRVQALGGRVDGALRFSHSWNHDGQNQSLMDLHVFGPNCQEWLINRRGSNPDEIHEQYPNGVRVGWNNRKDMTTGGNQDVDHTSEPGKSIPVENITFPHLHKMPEGKYTFKIHNWRARHPNTSGFKAEIEFDGNIFNYEYNKAVKHHQWITVAEATLKDGKFTIEHKMDNEASSKNVWGIDTNKWVKVNNILLSPNAWGQETTIGNEHLFFIIDACKTEDGARGIYNEFLLPDFEPHRKVFELLASKTKAQPTEQQASGLGFSSTRRDKVTVRVTGKTKRTFVINL